jgi:hypothetical protein
MKDDRIKYYELKLANLSRIPSALELFINIITFVSKLRVFKLHNLDTVFFVK